MRDALRAFIENPTADTKMRVMTLLTETNNAFKLIPKTINELPPAVRTGMFAVLEAVKRGAIGIEEGVRRMDGALKLLPHDFG